MPSQESSATFSEGWLFAPSSEKLNTGYLKTNSFGAVDEEQIIRHGWTPYGSVSFQYVRTEKYDNDNYYLGTGFYSSGSEMMKNHISRRYKGGMVRHTLFCSNPQDLYNRNFSFRRSVNESLNTLRVDRISNKTGPYRSLLIPNCSLLGVPSEKGAQDYYLHFKRLTLELEVRIYETGAVYVTDMKVVVEEYSIGDNTEPVILLKKETPEMEERSLSPNRDPKTNVICDFCNKVTEPGDLIWAPNTDSPLISGWMCRPCLEF